ncbi:MAG: glycosyltransferase, partial [Patescibacteria group bacterium]
MSKEILFIDGQVFQSEAWDRGMGKYSLALLKYMSGQEKHGFDKVYIIFTKNLTLHAEEKRLINTVVPEAKHIYADLQVPHNPSLADIPNLQKQNQKVLDELLGQYEQSSSDSISYLVLALFIDQVCSVFPSLGRKILLFYDLIPLQFSERYSQSGNYKNYLARYKIIFEAHIILTISQTVADDVALNLGISSDKIFNIDGAAIERSVKNAQKLSIEIPTRYILMPSGNEMRKNNINAVQGFGAYLQQSEDNSLALVITSTFDSVTQNELSAYADNVIFTGNVSEQELVWLYEHTEALLFVPEYEGLGLPILEACEVSKPIVCSNLAVFNEMSTSAFYYSDPYDPLSIAEALGLALNRTEFSEKLKEYPAILKKYTWENTARKALNALSSVKTSPRVERKLHIAMFAPTPSGYSAIGKLVMLMHPAMDEYFDIDYYLEDGRSQRGFTRPNYLPYISNVFPAVKFNRKKYKDYDAAIYHIGNSEFHLETIKNSLYLPGFAIVHDTHLANIFKSDLLAYGYVTENRLDAENALDKLINNPKTNYLSSIVNNQLALIAHSAFSKDGLDKSRLDATPRIYQLNIPTATPEQLIVRSPGKQVTIGLAGIIDPAKGLDAVENIAKMPDFFDCRIIIFGIPLVSDLVLQRLRSYPNVEVH